jgi:hypothetical protein
MKKFTHTKPQFNIQRFFSRIFYLILGFLTTAFFLTEASAQSRYTVDVVILDYYGAQGYDSSGRAIYGAKVEQGGYIYFVEMRDPMPCLISHKNEVARVSIDRNTSNWGKVTFDGHFAEIYKVTKVANERGSHAHRDSHSHNHDDYENRFKLPFSNWREEIFGSH